MLICPVVKLRQFAEANQMINNELSEILLRSIIR
jgi:hypothetical protein